MNQKCTKDGAHNSESSVKKLMSTTGTHSKESAGQIQKGKSCGL